MRYAYVASTITDRAELGHGPIDTEWLLEMLPEHKPVVFVDHESPGTQRLRNAGIQVFVSGKRPTQLPTGVTLSADHVLARLLLQEHRRTVFEAILYSTGVTTDLAWFEPSLASIPRGVALGEGPLPQLGLVIGDASLFGYFGRMLWTGTGFLTTADFILADVPASTYGLKDEAMPARFTSGLFDGLDAPSVPDEPPGLLVVVATSEDGVGLGQLLPRVRATVPIDAGTTVVVVHTSLPVGPETTRNVILGSCPADMATATILVAPGHDGSAARFVAEADAIVAAGPADLAIRAVAAAAQQVPYVLLRDDLLAAGQRLVWPPEKRQLGARAILVEVPDAFDDLVHLLDALMAVDPPDALVLHSKGFVGEARRFLDYAPLGGCDLAILSWPDPIYGSPSAEAVCSEVLVVSRNTYASVRRRIGAVESLWELIRWCLNLDLAEHVRLLVMPGSGEQCHRLPEEPTTGLPVWVTSTGALRRPCLGGDGGLFEGVREPEAIRQWAASHSWKERALLALPWRAGLLDRAMKDKW